MRSTEILQGTVFSWVYGLFRTSGDEELINRMTLIAIIYTIVVGLISILKPVPYGKHSTEQRFTMSARAAWIVSFSVSRQPLSFTVSSQGRYYCPVNVSSVQWTFLLFSERFCCPVNVSFVQWTFLVSKNDFSRQNFKICGVRLNLVKIWETWWGLLKFGRN